MPAPRARSVSQQRNRPRARGKPPDKTKLGRKVKATVEGAPKVSQACTKRLEGIMETYFTDLRFLSLEFAKLERSFVPERSNEAPGTAEVTDSRVGRLQVFTAHLCRTMDRIRAARSGREPLTMPQINLLEDHIVTAILPVKTRLVRQPLDADDQVPSSPGRYTTAAAAAAEDEAPRRDPELRLRLSPGPDASSSQSGQGEGCTSRDSSVLSEMEALADTDAGAGGKLAGDGGTRQDADEQRRACYTHSHSNETADEDDETCSVGLELSDEVFGISVNGVLSLGGASSGDDGVGGDGSGCVDGSHSESRVVDSAGGSRWSSSGGVGSSDFLEQLEVEGVFAAADSYSPNENLTGFSRDFLLLPSSPVRQAQTHGGCNLGLHGPVPTLTLASLDEERGEGGEGGGEGGGEESELRASPSSCTLVKEEPWEIESLTTPASPPTPPLLDQDSSRVSSSSSLLGVLDGQGAATDSPADRTDGDSNPAAATGIAAGSSSTHDDAAGDNGLGSGSSSSCGGGALQTASSLPVASWSQNAAACCSSQNGRPEQACDCSGTCSSRPVPPTTSSSSSSSSSSIQQAKTRLFSASATMPVTQPAQSTAQSDKAQPLSAFLDKSSQEAATATAVGSHGTVKTPTASATPETRGRTVESATAGKTISRTEDVTVVVPAAAAAGATSLSSGIEGARMTLGSPPRPVKRRRSSSLSIALLQPREVHYQCVACGKSYSAMVAGNPLWALVKQQCPVCHKMQIPRVDILNPTNNIEGHVSLLTEACAEYGTNGDDSCADWDGETSEDNSDGDCSGDEQGGTAASAMSNLVGEPRGGGSSNSLPTGGPTLDSEQAAKLLVLMCHARHCPGRHRSSRLAEVCRSVKFLMLHLRDCDGRTDVGHPCPLPWCRPCTSLLHHLVQCPDSGQCQVCNPLHLPSPLRALRMMNHRGGYPWQTAQSQDCSTSSSSTNSTNAIAVPKPVPSNCPAF